MANVAATDTYMIRGDPEFILRHDVVIEAGCDPSVNRRACNSGGPYQGARYGVAIRGVTPREGLVRYCRLRNLIQDIGELFVHART